MKMTRFWMLLAMGLLILQGCKKNAEPEGTLFVSGRIDGDTVDISSKIAGRIVDLKVREGDSVVAGDVVAWLYVINGYEGGLPSARYLGIMADAAEAAGAPADYVADLRARPCASLGA